jgi:pyridinium-3,5-biscarboxylic acid mononucleotide synthase
MNTEMIEALAKGLLAGRIPLEEFVRTLEGQRRNSDAPSPTSDDSGLTSRQDAAVEQTDSPGPTPRSIELDEVTLDVDRASRCGFPEVIYGEGKSVATIGQTVDRLRSLGQPVLCTRLDAAKASVLCRQFPDAIYHDRARTFRLPVRLAEDSPPPSPPDGQVALITAGTSDLPVAEEARETLLWMGITPTWIQDVGVAGPHRLREQLDKFTQAAVIIVVAGMEGALPSVVGGYARCPVIAVPTSVGYGASLGGIAPLLGMLNSCAANVLVVNIDAGFKAGYIAGLIARQTTPQNTENRTELKTEN